MRSTTAPELVLLHTPLRSEGCKVEIVRGGSAVDITDRVISGSISHSADEPVSTVDLVLDDDYSEYGTAASLCPLISTSSYNSPSELLWPNNDVKVYFGVNDLGSAVTSNELKLVFHGVLGDSIKPDSSRGSRQIKVHARDQAKRLQDHWIHGEYVYGSAAGTAAVAVVQSILNDCFSWDESSSDYKKLHIDATAYTNCDLVVYETKIGDCSCWDAIQKVIGCAAGDDLGFEIRYRFLPDGDTSTKDNEGDTITVSGDGFYLCLLQIDQSKSVADDSVDISTDSIEEHDIEIFDDMIRNDVYGHYIDRDTEEEMTLHREDMASIAAYGRRTMEIGQDDVPYIDTNPEMWALLGVCLNALKDVPATDGWSQQMSYHVEPNDLLDVTNALLATGSSKVGVTDISHEFQPGGGPTTRQMFRTTITGVRDSIVGGRAKFLTATGETTLDDTMLPSPVAGEGRSIWKTGIQSTETTLSFPAPANVQVESVTWYYATSGDEVWHEVTTSGPSLTIRGLDPGTTLAWTYEYTVRGGAR